MTGRGSSPRAAVPADRAARFAAVFATLHAAHQLGDHIAQTDAQAAGKTTDWRAMAGHVTSYHVTAAAMLAAASGALGLRLSPRRAVAGFAVSAATHALLDRRWPVRWVNQHTGSPGFADLQTPLNGPYLTDQALHYGCLWLAALIMAG